MLNRSQTRSEIIRLWSSLLLGPIAEDEVIRSAPSDTYLTGILWPQGANIDPAEDDAAEPGPDDGTSEVDAGVPGYRAIRPCSLGITFSVEAGSAVTVELGTTARYIARAMEGGRKGVSPDGPREWVRVPLGYTLHIPPENAARTWKTSRFISRAGQEIEDGGVVLHVRRRVDGRKHVLTVTLINAASETDDGTPRDAHSLFQAELIITANDPEGRGAIQPRPSLLPIDGDEDAESAALLYRDAKEFAVGHGVAAMWDAPADGFVRQVRTAWLPASSVKGMSAAGHPLLGTFQTSYPHALEAAWLGRQTSRDEIIPALRAFNACYAEWICTVLEPRETQFDGVLRTAAVRNLERCREALRRIGQGIDVLETDEKAWRAFVLANKAIDRQARYPAKGQRRGPLTWRPFQLAYILLVLPGLVNPDRPERECMDLLWFPTGGGKTEAYLGLTAFQIFLRRLTGGTHRDTGGVDVLMRYTLRLLTVQQFQRAASLICACELIRREETDLGSAAITLGLYVGGDATPNRMEEAKTALEKEQDGQFPKSTPRQLLHCPVCGDDLSPACYSVQPAGGGIDIICRGTDCETGGRPLPVLTVDEAIYASPPSLLIGTIDKFAQIPRNTELRRLFGLDGGLRPALIIQDELHLISGPLGSMAGLYETIVDLLCTDGAIRPKIIGSTATIGQAARQVRALFDRSVMQFPPAGFEASDSFFAVRNEDGPDRIYVGVASAGRSPKFALQATAAALLQAAETIRERGLAAPEELDAYWTCVLYFNSLRELGGSHVLMQDDVPRHMSFLSSRLGVPQRTMEQEPVELSSRVSSRDLPEKLHRLEAALKGPDGDPYAPQPEDTVLASNMISVGVDVSRLGLMVVNGQPKSTAEYIQASSRVGRGIEGLVVTLYNFGRPRDLSHFEHFAGYHAALYRSVEATSVTPWAPRARDKALHAVVAGVIRHLVSRMADDEAAASFAADEPEVQRLLSVILKRAASASDGIEAAETQEDLDAIVDQWTRRSQDSRASGSRLRYWEKKAPFGRSAPHLMFAAEEGGRKTMLAWATPNSMRDVEPSTAFILKKIKKA